MPQVSLPAKRAQAAHAALQEQQQLIHVMGDVGFGSGMLRQHPGQTSQSGTLSGRCWATASCRTQLGGDGVEGLRLSSMPWPIVGSCGPLSCIGLVLPHILAARENRLSLSSMLLARTGKQMAAEVIAQDLWLSELPAGVACQHFFPEGSEQQSSCTESINWRIPAASLWHEGWSSIGDA